MNKPEDLLNNREIIIEMLPVGSIMRVSAMDVATLTEVVIQGPVRAGDHVLRANVLKRLSYVLKNKGVL